MTARDRTLSFVIGILEHAAERIETLEGVLQAVQDSWGYISEYDVPVGLKDRIDAALADDSELRRVGPVGHIDPEPHILPAEENFKKRSGGD